MPFHGRTLLPPYHDVKAYITNVATGSLLTLTYAYEDEAAPRPTCLAQISVIVGRI